jgi:hypothetical protein
MKDEELERIQGTAAREGSAVAGWLRRAPQRALEERPPRARDGKIAAVRAAVGHAFPAPGIEEMLAEIDGDIGTQRP